MSLKTFRSYQQSIEFYRLVEQFHCPMHLRTQILRSASSIVLNLAEGYGKEHAADRCRFFRIALGSLRESQAVLDLCAAPDSDIVAVADRVGAMIYKLCVSSR